MKRLLDTDVLAVFLKGEPSVLTRIKASSPSSLHVSMVTRMEIDGTLATLGDAALKLAPVLDAFFSSISLIPFGEKEAAAAGILAASRSSNHSIGVREAILAGTALAHGLAVATMNAGQFGGIAGLMVEDWRQ